ncbi:hypothetical protein B0T14DRAFT_496954 [Immersiella caudata]|uniref:Uncharacterized protein n=1 Tax=Immersiella caudata TaxID=314043 RepID=A0AA40C040_9PEZI|nr:hypothetical protein B0T14DRAFT_496954 [Immersiella caudata]
MMQSGLIVSIVLTVVAFVALWIIGILARLGYLGPSGTPSPNPFLRPKDSFNEGTPMESGIDMQQVLPTSVDGPCGENVYNASPPRKPRSKLKEKLGPSVVNWFKKSTPLKPEERVEMPQIPTAPSEADLGSTSRPRQANEAPRDWFAQPAALVPSERVQMPDMSPIPEDAVPTTPQRQGAIKKNTIKQVPHSPSRLRSEPEGGADEGYQVSEMSDGPRGPRSQKGLPSWWVDS